MTIPPLAPAPGVLAFLETRRSRPARTLGPAAPDRATLDRWLAIAARTPDHGKLVPWRFLVLGPMTRARMAAAVPVHAGRIGLDPAKIEKTAAQFGQGGAVVAVVARPQAGAKVPAWEQELSAGAAAYALLMTALAAGWGANWLTGPFARDPVFLGETLGLEAHEFVAAFVHIGSETVVPPERDRPDPAAVTRWTD